MKSVLSPASSRGLRRRFSWRRFWGYNFLGRALRLGVASALGITLGRALYHIFVEALFYLSNGVYRIGWFQRLLGECGIGVVNGLTLGITLGLIVFSVLALGALRWDARRRVRFARGLKKQVFLLVFASITTIIVVGRIVEYTGRVRLPNALSYTGDIELNVSWVSTCLFVMLLARSSKTKPLHRKLAIQQHRLLPLD